ncbi:putative hydrolase of the alpha/beta-hydrolase fold protein [Thioflavicoccus mobilis 8321]|uniref:Putative hydrolase of the alpha/beta-hydrolase fold protein n=1 Tax=Thioflavicoccus mobilis 8321 TaxID=765912 RepID=L0GT06_9GAMM|nr:hydrolase [Thioflavicoccus mobilis]AGA89903.1 putative hydrolase of the alpha/beta-hydrolase fold protein [Thioflavicoccus mobilis 8321]
MGRLLTSDFRPAWWLSNAHLQTLWPSFARRRPHLSLPRRRIELPDGDFIDLAVATTAGPRVLVIHGLEGSLQSHYAGALVARLIESGYCPLFMHLRGCSDEPNRLQRGYHSGASDDLAAVLAELAEDPEGAPLAAVGFSLGGNLLLKYLGETDNPLVASAVAVSVPFVLRDAMLRLNDGISRIYRRYLLDKLKAAYRRKLAHMGLPADPALGAIDDIDTFDDRITAPLNGFAGAYDYYAQCSCRQFLPAITIPTLILHAHDDPFMYPRTVPYAHELGPGVTLELAAHGGHVGFIGGAIPGRPVYWLEERILRYLDIQAGTPPLGREGARRTAPDQVERTSRARSGGARRQRRLWVRRSTR